LTTPALLRRQLLELAQVRRRDGERAASRQRAQDRVRQRAALGRVRAAAHLVDERERIGIRMLQDLAQVLQVRRERGQARLDRLLVTDVREDVA
jgi:hypothetical protein